MSIILADVFSIFVIGFYFVTKKRSKTQFILILYLLYSLFTDYLINPIIKLSFHEYTLGLRLFTTLEFFAITYYFSKIIRLEHSRIIFIVLNALFLILSVQDFFINRDFVFDSIPTALSAVILTINSIIFFYTQIKQNNSLFLYDLPEFWNVVGILLYSSGTLFLFLFSQKYFNNTDFKILFNTFLSFFSIIRSILWATAIYTNQKHKA